MSDTLLPSSGNASRKALLMQYLREGSWTIAFPTGRPGSDVENYLQGEYVSVYVSTTPNPTSDFSLMVPKTDITELDVTVDVALKYIMSMGMVAPETLSCRMDPPGVSPQTEDRSLAQVPRDPSNPTVLLAEGGAIVAS